MRHSHHHHSAGPCGSTPLPLLESHHHEDSSPTYHGRGIVRKSLSGLIRLYQRFISPALPSSCRFSPSCSEYTRQSIIKHGPLKGIWLGTKRILKCHPFHPGGYDPVP